MSILDFFTDELITLVLGITGILIALFSAYFGYRLGRVSSQMDHALFQKEMYETILSTEFHNAKWYLYNFATEQGGIPRISYEKSYKPEIMQNGLFKDDSELGKHTQYMLRNMGEIAVYYSFGLVDKTLLVATQGVVFITLYAILKPFIDERKKTDPDYLNFLESLTNDIARIDPYKILKKFRKKKFPKGFMEKYPYYFDTLNLSERDRSID